MNLCKVVILFDFYTAAVTVSQCFPSKMSQRSACFLSPMKSAFIVRSQKQNKKNNLWLDVWLLSLRGVSALFGLECGEQAEAKQ